MSDTNDLDAVNIVFLPQCYFWFPDPTHQFQQTSFRKSTTVNTIFLEPEFISYHEQSLMCGADLFIHYLACGETIRILFLSGTTIQIPSKYTHTKSENSLTRCLQLRAFYCQTENTSMCTWPAHTQRLIILIQGTTGCVLTQASLSLAFTNLSSCRRLGGGQSRWNLPQ